MEDTKSLVTIFLQKIFHDRPQVIDNTYKIIYDYNNGERQKSEYEKTLKSICNQLSKEIPNQVLVYLLTLVDMPLDLEESDEGQLKPVIEKIKTLEEIQKTQNCLTDTIRPHLGECASTKVTEKDSEVKKSTDEVKEKDKKCDPKSNVEIIAPKPSIVKERANEVNISPQKPIRNKRNRLASNVEHLDTSRNAKRRSLGRLLDLTATSVIKNQKKLKHFYTRKFDRAWKLINSNQYSGQFLEQCYETLRDLNKKRKLLREIENESITDDVVADFYQDVDIFLKEKNMYDVVNADLFEFVERQFS